MGWHGIEHARTDVATRADWLGPERADLGRPERPCVCVPVLACMHAGQAWTRRGQKGLIRKTYYATKVLIC